MFNKKGFLNRPIGNAGFALLSKYRQELYGISIISVVVFHYLETLLDSGVSGIQFYIAKGYVYVIGSAGVDVFLFLSGMGIFQSLKRSYPDVKSFYIKRAKKVLLPYAVIGLIFWIIKDCIVLTDASSLVQDYLLLTFWTRGTRTLWYIALILLLYIVSPALYVLCNLFLYRNKRDHSWIIIVIVVAASFLLKILSPGFFNRCEIAILRIPVFLLGFINSDRIISGTKVCVKDILFLLLFLPICAGCYVLDSPFIRYGNSLFAVFLAMVLVLFFSSRSFVQKKINVVLAGLGGISYELYLLHVMGRNILNTISFGLENVFVYIGFIVICIILSVALHKLLDIKR